MTAEPVPIRPESADEADYIATVPGLPLGAWSGSLRAVDPTSWTDDASGETRPTYRWTWDADIDGTTVEYAQTTGRRLTKNSTFLAIAVALAGPAAITPAARIDVRELVGREAILSCAADPDGGYRVTVTGVPKRSRR